MANELTGSLAPTGAKMKAEVMDDHVVFRGAIKAEVPFEEIVAEARGTLLMLTFRGNVTSFGAGARSSQLASKIRSPPSWMDRLHVTYGTTAAVAGPVEAAIKAELSTRADVATGPPKVPVGLLLFAVEAAAGLDALPRLGPLVAPGGTLWLIHPEGAMPVEKVAAAAKAAGFVAGDRVRFPGSRHAVCLRRP